jgi:ComF family protein
MKFRAEGPALKTLCALVKAALPPDFCRPELVVPVPLHPKRLRERGFNQAVSLARGIFPSSPIALDSIKRIRDTRSQAGLPARDRLENVKDAFTLARPLPPAARRATILDDVFTTGATVRACAKVLLKSGIQKIDVFTIARTVRH